MIVVTALTGVSVTFAPLGLYYAGQARLALWNPLVLLAFSMVYFVPLAYIAFARPILTQLTQKPKVV